MFFQLKTPYKPSGDQVEAIEKLVEGINQKKTTQTLLGVTGSGKTFTISNVISQVQKPILVISHNKTLAAQLYGEFRSFFPNDKVEFFISYYDYYQPESYIPQTDTYIAKDASINSEIDRLRLRSTSALLSGDKNVIIVSSVSCIYGIGAPHEWMNAMIILHLKDKMSRSEFYLRLVEIHYSRNDFEFTRGTFRVRGSAVEIFPAYENDEIIRVEFFGEEIEKIFLVNPLNGEIIQEVDSVTIYPSKQFITSHNAIENAIDSILKELDERINELKSQNKLLEANRLEQRTIFDITMMREVGYCAGIENYSRHLDGREKGSRPYCLLDYFPKDFLIVIDESHVTVPQIRGMYNGDRSRKQTLVDWGFRLPSALDNRPLKFDEFEKMINQVIFVSATPSEYEIKKSNEIVVEQIIRPTGLLDPEIEIRPIKYQVDDLISEIRKRVNNKERILVTTLTKRMAEDLSEYFSQLKISVRYIHSDIDALERVEILRSLRLGNFDVLVGVNLLREGLDLPEVSLVAILDADKEGFLRSKTSLIQLAGRAARNINGKVILYADKITNSIEKMMSETTRRRKKQTAYNKKFNIIPKTIQKSVEEILSSTAIADVKQRKEKSKSIQTQIAKYFSNDEKKNLIEEMENEMKIAAKNLDFEKAIFLRDRVFELKNKSEG